MKKIKIVVLSILILISLNTNVLAISTSHVAASTAARIPITAATVSRGLARRHKNTYTIDKAIEDIYNETQNEDLKNYILENKQYLYLNHKDKAEAVINKYKESNIEEAKQFIKDNYYDENKPENEKRAMIVSTILIVIIFVIGIIFAITAGI